MGHDWAPTELATIILSKICPHITAVKVAVSVQLFPGLQLSVLLTQTIATHRHSKVYSAKLRLATPSSLSNCHRNTVNSVTQNLVPVTRTGDGNELLVITWSPTGPIFHSGFLNLDFWILNSVHSQPGVERSIIYQPRVERFDLYTLNPGLNKVHSFRPGSIDYVHYQPWVERFCIQFLDPGSRDFDPGF